MSRLSATHNYGIRRTLGVDPPDILFHWQPNYVGLTPAFGEGIGTFVRATTGAYTDSNGVIQSAASGIHRNQDGGILLEPQRTNLCTRSEELDNGAWGKTRSTVSVNAVNGLDGTLTADKLVEDSGGGTHFANGVWAEGSPLSTHTQSVFVKAAGRTWILLVMTGPNVGKYFDLTNGVAGLDHGAGPEAFGIEDWGNGWYRCWIAATTSGGACQQTLYLASGDGTFSYGGDDSSGVYCWGMQSELGGCPTSYIPTSGSAVTRNADSIDLPFTKTFETGFTVFAQAVSKCAAPIASTMLNIGGTADIGEYRFSIVQRNTKVMQATVAANGAAAQNYIGVTETIDGEEAYDYTFQYGPVNGVLHVDDTQEVSAALNDVPGAAFIPDPATGVANDTGNNAWVLKAFLVVRGVITPAVMRTLLRS